MGMFDFLSGGHDDKAAEILGQAQNDIKNVATPTEAQLTLPQLQQYVQAGLMTPAQAQAILQKQNAFDSISTDPKAKEAEMTALNQMQNLASNGGNDAQSEAGVANAESTMNQTLAGQRGSILDQMAQRGIPTSLMGTAAELGFAGQDAEQAHKDALQAKADAANRALTAMAGAGQLGGNIEAQNYGEQAQKASSQNAIDQWNAANQTNVNLANQQAQQQANLFNTQNAQNVSNANVQNANARTQYNAQAPETDFQNKLQKAGAEAGVATNRAQNEMQQGQQNAGGFGALLGTAGTVIGGIYGGPAGAAAGGTIAGNMGSGSGSDTNAGMMSRGGEVPGTPVAPGNSPANDTVHAMLSPGEVVIPRTVAHSPNLAAEFVRHLHKAPRVQAHPEDIKNVLHALTAMRGGQ